MGDIDAAGPTEATEAGGAAGVHGTTGVSGTGGVGGGVGDRVGEDYGDIGDIGDIEAAQAGAVHPAGLDVGFHRVAGEAHLEPGPLDLRGDPGHQGARRHLEALGYQAGRRHDRAGPDGDPVQRDRARADQAPVPYHAAFQVRVVPDHAVGPDQGRPLAGAVHHGPVLHRRPRADLDPAVVAAQHGARPHGRLGADRDPADDDRLRVDERGLVDLGLVLAQRVYRHYPGSSWRRQAFG